MKTSQPIQVSAGAVIAAGLEPFAPEAPMFSSKASYKVCVNYVTQKGIAMFGRKFPCLSENETHVELHVVATGERVVFTKKEVL